jgi:3-dehydroquinate dehydratase I
MHNARICAVIAENNIAAAHGAERLADLFEVRIDLVGKGWDEMAASLHKPWVATNRDLAHGGAWRGSENHRIDELLKAVKLGAQIVDIEMDAGGLADIVKSVKTNARCIVSFHDHEATPSIDTMADIVQKQLDAGADICKIVGTARSLEDNITMLSLIKRFPWADIISFAMGPDGLPSRILSPLAGGYLTYAALEKGKESAPGQLCLETMHGIYRLIQQ